MKDSKELEERSTAQEPAWSPAQEPSRGAPELQSERPNPSFTEEEDDDEDEDDEEDGEAGEDVESRVQRGPDAP
jgi:hypothetical protein